MRGVTAATRAVLYVLVFLVSFSRTSLVAAGGEAITDRLAHILLNFTHVPSVSQEETRTQYRLTLKFQNNTFDS